MSSTNPRAGNAAHVASGKRKSTHDEVGSSSKRVALELFPTQPKQNELIHVSQSPALNHVANGGLNMQSFTSLLTGGHNVQSVPLETQEDPFDRLFKSQYEKMRETCKQDLNNKYNYLLRQAEERASTICREKDSEMAHMKSMISYFQEKLSSQNEVINTKITELDNSRRRNIELEEQVVHYKSQAEDWKEKVQRAEKMLWNASPGRQAPCCCQEEEDTALSCVGETRI
ncbi:hypothetical protein POM88_042296 [Heracleum sosnowskyi]|uniref:Uncharacterized protein n=1 Tax=Heracleum sosnowskyi TaxID=360622 RepID=A0AAD8M927_9APIA|nr:hypothetical protein POM88_042296 [Heracleum sosnowskyi]